ncbi:MAG: radical SAM protein [Methanothrix sp.]
MDNRESDSSGKFTKKHVDVVRELQSRINEEHTKLKKYLELRSIKPIGGWRDVSEYHLVDGMKISLVSDFEPLPCPNSTSPFPSNESNCLSRAVGDPVQNMEVSQLGQIEVEQYHIRAVQVQMSGSLSIIISKTKIQIPFSENVEIENNEVIDEWFDRGFSQFHIFDFFGKKILFDINSFYLFEIDCEYNKEKMLESGIEHGIHDYTNKIDLINAIFPFSIAINTFDLSVSRKRMQKIAALYLNLAYGCNMRCVYCFAGDGNYGMQNMLMDTETAKRAIDFLFKANKRGSTCYIVFFGGEPLLNYDVLKICTLYAEDKAKENNSFVTFHLVTNGTLLTEEIVQFLKNHKIVIQISLDGPSHLNDKLRQFPDGRGSFECVYSKLLMLKNLGIIYLPVRATITHYNCEIENLVKYFSKIGFTDSFLEPVMFTSDTDYSLTDEDIDTIKKQYRKKADEIIESIGNCRETDLGWFSEYISRLYNGTKKRYHCNAGISILTVTPEGKLYLCHRLAGKNNLDVGNLNEGLKTNPLDLQYWGSISVDERKSCLNCWAKYFCGGGCDANSFLKYGNLSEKDDRFCKIFKANVENAIRIYYYINTISKENIFIEYSRERKRTV